MRWQNPRARIKSCDPRVMLETHCGCLLVKEHGGETLNDDVEVVVCNAMTISKKTVQIL